MTDQQLETSNDLVSSEGIFLRAADRSRFDYVIRAVRESSQSLALSSNSDGVLDHYGRLLLAKLRKSTGLHVEVFLPQNTEQLLERFNQILSDISIEDARNPNNSLAPRRVLLAHDAKAINQRDLQLLARLVQDFPGANVSLVVLVDKIGLQVHGRTLDSVGQRLLRWPVEVPTRAEGEVLLSVARGMGLEIEAKKVLAATGYAEIKLPPKPKKEISTKPSTAQERFEAQLAAAREERQPEPAPNDPAQQARVEPSFDVTPAAKPILEGQKTGFRGTFLRLSAAALLLLFISFGLILVLFADKASPLLVSSPTIKDNLPPWAMDTLISLVGKPPTAKLEEQKSSEAAGAATLEKAAPPSVPPIAADSSDAKMGSTPDRPEAEIKASSALAPRSERGVDQLVRQTKAGSFYVQHVSLSSMAEAQEWRAQYSSLTRAMIIAIDTPEKGVRFAVISGPFATRTEAKNYAARNGMPPGSWLRPVRSLQKSLLPAGR